MFYQQLGGTKTMRQLNRTEKQLLSILAVYQQMGSAGALGDMTKTLNQFANQSRMMTEYWTELKMWSGLILKDFIDQYKILVYINAALITITEIIKAIARSKSLGEENFIDGLFETTEATNDEIDELQGKLLEFDKFRSLQGAEESTLSIDEKLIEAISGYSSYIQEARNEAQELSKTWLESLGFTSDINGELIITDEQLNKIKNVLNSILVIIGSLIAIGIGNKLLSLGSTILPSISLAFMEIATTTKLTQGNVTLLGKAYQFLLSHPVVAVLSAIAIALIYLYNTNEEFRQSVNLLVGSFKPFLEYIELIINNLVSLEEIISPLANFAINKFSESLRRASIEISAIMLILVPLAYVMETILKTIQTLVNFLPALFSWDWSKIGNIWSDWDSKDFAKSTWQNLQNSVENYKLPDQKITTQADISTSQIVSQNSNLSGIVTSNIESSYQAHLSALNNWWITAKKDLPQLEEANPTGMYQAVTGVAKSYGNKWSQY
jgi:hypothetical protein